jgi:CBS domain containing-hemolysin-like protein
MDVFSWAGIALLVLCLGLVVFVAAAEAGLISISRARVRLLAGRGVPRAEILRTYIEERSSLLGAFALARNVAIVAGAALAVSILTRERGHSWALVIGIVIVALALFALLEAVPRALVARNPERWGLRLTPFIGPFKLLFGGAGRILSIPARAVARPVSNDEEEEMLRLLEIEEDEGEIEDDERKMIRGVFGLEDTAVREIMTPRTDFAAVDDHRPWVQPHPPVRKERGPNRRHHLRQGPLPLSGGRQSAGRSAARGADRVLRAGIEAVGQPFDRHAQAARAHGDRGGRVRRHGGPGDD